jgi:uncharacterized protein (TIGR03790 family)
MLRKLQLICSFIGVCVFALDARADEISDAVVILVNSNDPASIRVGEYYAEARDIPLGNVIALPMSQEETIQLETYVDTICNPLLERLIEDGWVNGLLSSDTDRYGRQRMALVQHRISYLVLVRGVPTRIANAPETLIEAELNLPKQFQGTNGSVDGELALLLGSPMLPMAALIQNPLFENPFNASFDAQRVIKVSRLDGPSEGVLTRLIDRTLEAEATGLVGRAYFDLGGPGKAGDDWMRAASELAKAAYFDTEVESTSREIDFTDRIDAPAIYIGWYKSNAYGPWLSRQWQVPLGAIGLHLHSFSATTVRSKTKAWLGPMIERGFSATVGNAYEPYLQFTHRFDLILKYLLDGHTFGDAVMWSNPALSWQGIAIGDPLYRPFQRDLEQQDKEEIALSLRPYFIIRLAKRELETKGEQASLDYLRVEFMREPSLVLAHYLGKLYLDLGETAKAMEAFRLVGYLSRFSMDEWILAKEVADFMSANGDPSAAFGIYQKLIREVDIDETLLKDLLEDGVKLASVAGEYATVTEWTFLLNSLQPEG